MYDIVISESVLKKLRDIPKDDRLRFYEKIETVAENPFADIPFVKRLTNSPYYRFRFGDYRCVYQVEKLILTVTVIDVGHRKDIYRRKK
jgi:mRNA interferase RelE/StbE